MACDSKLVVKRTIQRQAAGRIPAGELCIDDALVAAFLGCSRVGFRQRRQLADFLGMDLICIAADYGPRSDDSALASADFVGLHAIQEWAVQTDLFIFVLIDGAFEWGVRSWGFQRFLIMVMRQSDELSDLLRRVDTLNRLLIRRAADLGADGIVIADDIAYQRGLLLHPDQIRKLFLPSLARQVEACHAAGLSTFFHSDGNIGDLLEDIVASGFDGLQGIESASGMDLAAIKADHGHRLCLWGNLDPACLVQESSAETIDARVAEVLASGARDGGLIFGTSSGLFKAMRPRSIERAYRYVAKWGERRSSLPPS